DIFYKVAKDEDLNSYHYQFYHFVNNKIKAITLPEHEHIEATFSNDFMIEINLSPSEKFKIDVSAHKDMYINDKIYNSNVKNKDIKISTIKIKYKILIVKIKEINKLSYRKRWISLPYLSVNKKVMD